MKSRKFLLAVVMFYSLQSCGVVDTLTRSSFTLAIWNIGNFSNGAKGHSTIDIAKDPNIGQKYRDFIYKTINSDVLVINEYTNVFYTDQEKRNVLTDSSLFNSFRYRFIGPDCWKCNAIFSKYAIKNLDNDSSAVCYFTSHKSIKDDINVSKRETYYLETIVDVKGSCFKIVTVHIDHSRTVLGIYQQAQIAELIKKYKDEERVIICGDFNTQNLSKFKNSGFSVVNDGFFKTYPLKGYAIDNIVYKGVVVSNVQMHPTTLSDHNPLVCTITF